MSRTTRYATLFIALTLIAVPRGSLAEEALELRAAAAVEQVHKQIWKRFVDPYNVVLDYTDL